MDAETLVHEAPCGLLTLDEGGLVTAVNDTFLAWTRRRREDVVGAPFRKLLAVGDQILWSTHGAPQLAVAGAVAEMAVDVLDVDRVRRSTLISAARGRDRSGAVEDRVVVFHAHERLAYERTLVEALRRADESEAAQAQAEADLAHLTHHDALTGLPNRVQVVEALAERLAGGVPTALLLVDLDHFAAVNESLGSPAGDDLLALVARRVRDVVPASALVGRLTADELVVVTADGELDALGRALLDAVATPATIDGLEIVTTATVGVARAEPGRGAEVLLVDAGRALRRGKARGGACCEVHDPAQGGDVVDDLRLLGELRTGIPAGELRLHHQPRVLLATGALDGVEVLVRWQHATRGLLPPAAFVDAAERSGLIVALGAWVLDTAVAQAARWWEEAAVEAAASGLPVEVLVTAVNLSTRQLADPRVVDQVAATLDRHGLPPRYLTLEITETALLQDADAALRTLTGLKALGVGLSVDDFGTGYSSLTYLKRFPVDELKIDRSFVTGLGTDGEDAAIVAGCIQLAHGLGIRAVAEGVETEAQRSALVDLGCDMAQGYLFARPLPADELDVWRRAHHPAPEPATP